jgi:hypothetical protein
VTSTIDEITTAAAKRLDTREDLVEGVVIAIANKHRSGWKTGAIVNHLRGVFKQDAPQAQPEFVEFVTNKL